MLFRSGGWDFGVGDCPIRVEWDGREGVEAWVRRVGVRGVVCNTMVSPVVVPTLASGAAALASVGGVAGCTLAGCMPGAMVPSGGCVITLAGGVLADGTCAA